MTITVTASSWNYGEWFAAANEIISSTSSATKKFDLIQNSATFGTPTSLSSTYLNVPIYYASNTGSQEYWGSNFGTLNFPWIVNRSVLDVGDTRVDLRGDLNINAYGTTTGSISKIGIKVGTLLVTGTGSYSIEGIPTGQWSETATSGIYTVTTTTDAQWVRSVHLSDGTDTLSITGIRNLNYSDFDSYWDILRLDSTMIGTHQNDFFDGSWSASDIFDGKSGIDVVVYGLDFGTDITITISENVVYVNKLSNDFDSLIDVERINFNNGVLALDVDSGETAGQAYRLYQAAFARTPDMSGVSYHMNDIEANGLALENVANNFIASPEFKSKYGENPSDDVFIDLLYQNVLGRAADDSGLAFYKNHFNEGTMTRAAALIGFAESPENVNLVAPQIEDGIWLAS